MTKNPLAQRNWSDRATQKREKPITARNKRRLAKKQETMSHVSAKRIHDYGKKK